MNCPDCGAPLRLDADKDYLICDFCGNIHVPGTNDDGVRVLEETALEECPICIAPLVHAAIDGQRILYCRHCRGMLISMDIFAPLIEDLRSRRAGNSGIVKPLDTSELDRVMHCPHCRRVMDTHVYGGGGNVVISDCETCQVNWLDNGELDRIVRAPDQHFDYAFRDVPLKSEIVKAQAARARVTRQ